jgi:hypothetical protein
MGAITREEVPMSTPSTAYPALERLRAHLDAHEGRLGAAEAPLAIDALKEYLASGATLGRSLRDETARFRPTDEVGATVAYLFIVTVDAATHANREAPLAAYAETDKPLAKEAGELYGMLTSEAFLEAAGRRPLHGGLKGCSTKKA